MRSAELFCHFVSLPTRAYLSHISISLWYTKQPKLMSVIDYILWISCNKLWGPPPCPMDWHPFPSLAPWPSCSSRAHSAFSGPLGTGSNSAGSTPKLRQESARLIGPPTPIPSTLWMKLDKRSQTERKSSSSNNTQSALLSFFLCSLSSMVQWKNSRLPTPPSHLLSGHSHRWAVERSECS